MDNGNPYLRLVEGTEAATPNYIFWDEYCPARSKGCNKPFFAAGGMVQPGCTYLAKCSGCGHEWLIQWDAEGKWIEPTMTLDEARARLAAKEAKKFEVASNGGAGCGVGGTGNG